MITKPKSDSYYQDQNARSGTGANANSLWQDLRDAGIEFNRNWVVLDIGCRTAITLNNLWKQGCRNVWGIDIGERAQVHWKEQKYPFIENLVCEDIHSVDLTPGFFDLITISHALEHLYDPNSVLKEMINSLKSGGMIHSIVPIEPESDFGNHRPHLVRFESHQDHIDFYSPLSILYDRKTNHNNSIVIFKKLI